MVHDAARRSHDDVYASAQRRELLTVALVAVDRKDVHAAQMRGILLERLAHLQGQLAGGSEHECLRGLLRQVEPGEDRQRECCRLSGASLCETDDVASRQ